ncbi:MAG: DegT/DnrJ/EryC1/StrS family aminotransferase [Planctomycetota bacterium]
MHGANRRGFLKSSATAAAGASVLGAPAVIKAHAKAVQGPLPSPFPRTIGPNAAKYVQEVIETGLTGAGRMIARFEQAFARELGVKHCMATPGCTPALAALAAAFRFQPGDEIIVSPISDYGTLQGLVRENYIPVFADAAPGSVNLSAETIEPCITDRTRGILVVHKTGLICDMDPINELAKKHGLIVYEDGCQAVFGEYKGRLVGTLGNAAAFSFDSEKTLGSDIGGCVVTDDDELAQQVRVIGQGRGVTGSRAGFGRIHSIPGYAYRMPGCTAAICLAQLEIIREQVAHRDKMIRLLTKLLREIPGITPLAIPDFMNVYSAWMCSFSIDPEQFNSTADEFAEQVRAAGVPGAGTARYYLLAAGSTFLEENARKKSYPYSMPPASREYHYGTDSCPTGWKFLQTWIRWSSFCEKYTQQHCELAQRIVKEVADRNRK